MKILRSITEDDMISVFLKSEISSRRFRSDMENILKEISCDESIISHPDLKNESENLKRKKILSQYRGFDKKLKLFESFPKEVSWVKAELGKDEVLEIKYINYSYWNELSGNSRLPQDAVATILSGKQVFGVSNQDFLDAAESLRKGNFFPELILVGLDETSKLVVLEGHLRLTAYALVPEYIPDPLEVIIGFSKDFSEWLEYKD